MPSKKASEKKLKKSTGKEKIQAKHAEKNVEYLETGIDRLLNIVNKRKSILLSKAANELKVSEDVIENWGGILESHDLIKMHYPIVGEPSLDMLTEEDRKTKEEKKKDRLEKKKKEDLEKKKKKELEKKRKSEESIKKKTEIKTSIWGKIKGVLFHPQDFFEYSKTESGIKGAFKYNAILGLIPLAVSTVLLITMSFILSSFLQAFSGMAGAGGTAMSAQSLALISTIFLFGGIALALIFLIFGFLCIIIMPFISAGIMHLFAGIIFKGQGRYKDAYRVVVYSLTPAYLFGWLIFGFFWQIYLIVKGVSVTYRMSMLRSFLASYIVPGAVIGGLIMAVMTLVYNLIPVMEPMSPFSSLGTFFLPVGNLGTSALTFLFLIVLIPIIILMAGFLLVVRRKKSSGPANAQKNEKTKKLKK